MKDIFIPERRANRDRRAFPRAAASGAVEITIELPVPAVVQVELIESSRCGFRAVHDSNLLEPGLTVNYKGKSSSGQARIIWTHILQGRRVSGFVTAPDDTATEAGIDQRK
ncbi:MAG TPA: hypothetical protein VMB85_00505 [Bryobacteraceae bacterium]|jgi:hypothetical protein|nr:hypothetical protein [Bryobacteraceae bacterium]